MEENETSMVSESLIRKGDIVIVKGNDGIGITWFCLELSYKMSMRINGTALNWFDSQIPIHAIYYEGGMPYQELIRRHELLKPPSAETAVEIRSFDRIYREEKTFPTFHDCRFFDRCETELGIGKYGLIFYDNTTTLFGDSENDKNLSHSEILRRIITLRQKEVTQIFIEGEFSGFSIPASYADLVLELGKAIDSENLRLNVRIKKSRYIMPNKQDSFQIELRSDENGKLKFEVAEDLDEVKVKVLSESLNGKKQKNIAEELNVDQATISRWLKSFERKGLIKRKGRKISLTDNGREWMQNKKEVLLK